MLPSSARLGQPANSYTVFLLLFTTAHSVSFGSIFGNRDSGKRIGKNADQKPLGRPPVHTSSEDGSSQIQEALSLLQSINVSNKAMKTEKHTGFVGATAYYAKEAFVLLFMNGPSQKTLRTEEELATPLTKPLSTAVKLLEDAAAKKESSEALFLLAEMNFWGNFTHPRNYKQAFRRYQELAELTGNATAQHMLGFFYATGFANAVERDQAKAQLYHAFAAEQGNIRSEMTLAFRASSGIGTRKDCDNSAHFYKRVADKAIEYSRSGPPGGQVLPRDSFYLVDDVGGVYGEGASHSSSGYNAQRARHHKDGNDDNILEYLDLLSRSGEPKAIFSLGKLYYDGDRGRKRNFRLAKKYFMKVARKYWNEDDKVIKDDENPAAWARLASKAAAYIGTMYLRGEGVKQNFAEAKRWFKLGLTTGDAFCQYELGLMYLQGLGVREDPVRAAEFLKQAASQDWPAAQARLGRLFLDQGDLNVAQRYFEFAARHLNIEAIYYLAEINNLKLEGRERNCAGAQSFYKIVSEKAEPLHSDLGEANRMYEDGDLEGAIVRYLMAAEQGYESAQANIAWILDEHKSILNLDSLLSRLKSPSSASKASKPSIFKDAALALVYWTRSARQWNTDSAVKMGDAYFSGSGTPVDLEKAFTCYQTAADLQGSAQAMWNLGWMYENGIGAGQDFHLAKRYYDLALEVSPEAHLPVKLALWKLRMRSRWNDWIGGDVKSMEYDDDDAGEPKYKTWSEWFANFLEDEQLYYDVDGGHLDGHAGDAEYPWDDGTDGPMGDEYLDDIDEGAIETLMILSLVGLLGWLFWYRQQRQQQAEQQAQHHGNRQANQQANVAAPPPNDPNLNIWAPGGVGH